MTMFDLVVLKCFLPPLDYWPHTTNYMGILILHNRDNYNSLSSEADWAIWQPKIGLICQKIIHCLKVMLVAVINVKKALK